MTEGSYHPKGSLVVPTRVIPAFQGAIIPQEKSSLPVKPVDLPGKLKYYAQKSSIVTMGALATGSGSVILSLHQLVPNPDPLTAVAVAMPLVLALSTGLAGFVVGLQSILDGSREYAPLPPSKKYLALEDRKKEAVIIPFDEWDAMFKKHDSCVQKTLNQ